MFSFPFPCQYTPLSEEVVEIGNYHFRQLMEQKKAFGSDACFLQIRQNNAAAALGTCRIFFHQKMVLISLLF